MGRSVGEPCLASPLARFTALLVIILLLGGCSLPSLANRPISSALSLPQAQQTALGRALREPLAGHPGQSGIAPLSDPQEAFAARLALAERAERTLDVQYYIWKNDISGTLLLDALYRAAERGVRVRLLLDDNGTTGLDWALAALDQHPNIEVRLFNPFAFRPFKALGYITAFSRANRRMHNKSFTADNQVSIVGGRNVGDEYFGATQGVLFADLDALAVGRVVPQVSDSFDRYWASPSSYPVAGLLNKSGDIARLRQQSARFRRSARAQAYLRATGGTAFVKNLLENRLSLIWAATRLVSDDPAKGIGQAREPELMTFKLNGIIGEPGASLDLVSPYFVPTKAGVWQFQALARRGVRLRVLTNALESTDVAAVHAGYAKRRKALLRLGVQLYEMRGQAEVGPRGGKEKPEKEGKVGFLGSSGTSLHAKTFAVDGQRFFVGSFNFDPRSARLNTELGLIIDSPELAAQLGRLFDERVPQEAYQIGLDGKGDLYWLERRGDQEIRHYSEPGGGFFQRLGLGLLSWLPIEWLL